MSSNVKALQQLEMCTGRILPPALAGVTVTYLKSYVTGSNDAILNEVG
jgi:hypothetical protein